MLVTCLPRGRGRPHTKRDPVVVHSDHPSCDGRTTCGNAGEKPGSASGNLIDVEYVAALAPTAGVVFLFWLAFRAIFRADRAERAAVARYERESGTAHGGARGRVDDRPEIAGAASDDRRDS